MADELDEDGTAVLDRDLEQPEAHTETAYVDDGDAAATPEPAGVLPPGTDLQGLTDEELDEMGRRIDAGEPAFEEPTPEKAKDEDEDVTPAGAKGTNGKRIRTTLDHLEADDQALQLAILTETRKGLTLEAAIAKVMKPKAQAVETSPAEVETKPVAALQSASIAAKEAKEALKLARESYDAEAIEQAEEAYDLANRALVRQELREELDSREAEKAQRNAETSVRAEVEALVKAIPQLSDPEDPLTAVYDRLIDRAKPTDTRSAEDFARDAWAKVYPGKAFPAGTAARQSNGPIVQPPKNGRPVAALSTNGGTRMETDIFTNPQAMSRLTDDELDAQLRAAG